MLYEELSYNNVLLGCRYWKVYHIELGSSYVIHNEILNFKRVNEIICICLLSLLVIKGLHWSSGMGMFILRTDDVLHYRLIHENENM